MEVNTIGLDLAKNVFQVHGADATGAVVLRKQLRRDKVLSFFAGLPPLYGGDGSLRWSAPLGARDRQDGTYGPPDPCGLCETFREAAEE